MVVWQYQSYYKAYCSAILFLFIIIKVIGSSEIVVAPGSSWEPTFEGGPQPWALDSSRYFQKGAVAYLLKRPLFLIILISEVVNIFHSYFLFLMFQISILINWIYSYLDIFD